MSHYGLLNYSGGLNCVITCRAVDFKLLNYLNFADFTCKK